MSGEDEASKPRGFATKLWSLRYPVLLMVVLQAFDTLSTLLALRAGAQEVNPVMAQTMAIAGGEGLLTAKWAAILLVFIAIWIDPLDNPYIPAALIIMNAVYLIALSGNFFAYAIATNEWGLSIAFWALVVAIAAGTGNDVMLRRQAVIEARRLEEQD